MSLFPTYIENDEELETEIEETKPPKEYEIDFTTGQLTGKIVEGLAAIEVWIWLVLQTARYRYQIYSWDYGNEYEELVGQGYSEEYIETEALRLTEDALLVNENIQSITDFSATLNNEKLTISFTANTIYGEIVISNHEVSKAA
jgi:hypothetical protein